MKQVKRKKRKTLAKSNIDIMKPVDLSVVGTENDPCFGKHHDATAPECQRCGDSEFCQIATMNRLKSKRLKLEAKNSYKDLEEADIQGDRKTSVKRKAFLYLRTKLKSRDYLSRKKAIVLMAKKFNWDSDKSERMLDRVLASSQVLNEENKKIYFNGKSQGDNKE